MTNANQGTALITGASSGIGAVYADRLARRGYDLILVARDQAKLDAVAKNIVAETGREVAVIRADLTLPDELAAVEQCLRDDSSITMLVNNAGLGAARKLLDSPPAEMDAMMSININALTRLSLAAMPALVARGKGAIINIASIVALSPELLNGVYSASKSYVLVLTQSMHGELKDKGVQVQAVLPGATATAFWGRAGVDIKQLPSEWVMTTEDMVDAALAAFDQGELVTIPSLPELTHWNAFEAARLAMGGDLSHAKPAARYFK